LWVVNDSTTDKVYKYTLSGSALGSWTIDAANASPTGLTINPSNVSDIWIVDNGTKKVYQYTAAAGRISGSQNAAATFALAAGNTNPQDIADPPTPGRSLTPAPVPENIISPSVQPVRAATFAAAMSWLDDNAADGGWSLDATPGAGIAYTTSGNQRQEHRTELTTVLAHESGRSLSYEHSEPGASATGNVMADALAAGVRHVPGMEWACLDAAIAEWSLTKKK